MFICLGLYFVGGRFLVDPWMRRSLRYAVTHLRILIARPSPFSRFTALSLQQLPKAYLKERANGQGHADKNVCLQNAPKSLIPRQPALTQIP